MAINYPTSLDTFTDPNGTQYLNSPDHAGLHTDINSAIEELQKKVGIGSGTPQNNYILGGGNGGTAVWQNKISNLNIITPTIKQWDGWQELDTVNKPTYASATTMTNPTGVDWTDYLEVGDSLSWDDGSAKLGYVSAVTSTTLTIAGDSVAIATINNFKYSKIPGKAGWLDWTPTYDAGGSMTYTSVTTDYAKFRMMNGVVEYLIRAVGTTGGTASTFISATTPIVPVQNSTGQGETNDGNAIAGFVQITTGGVIAVFKYDGSNFGLGPLRSLRSSGKYLI